MDTYKLVAKIFTVRDLAQIFVAITPSDWTRGKFFICPEGIPPLMENAKNIRGGSYSMRVERTIVGEVMQRHIIAAIFGCLTTEPGNQVRCVRITPRRDFNILQVWNNDCQKYSTPDGLVQIDTRIPKSEVMYKPHVEKKI